MIQESSKEREPVDVDLVGEVDALNEEVKTLALNLAIYLAKAKNKAPSPDLTRLEPDFIRLVNGAVKVVQEMSVILNAARNSETVVYEVPSGKLADDHLAVKLRSVAAQCSQILASLADIE